jgi:hypothetical protein
MNLPAERLHLRAEGLPEDTTRLIAMVLAEALRFCAQAGTFPAFRAFAGSNHSGLYAQAFATLDRGVLTEIQIMIAAGVLADMGETS